MSWSAFVYGELRLPVDREQQWRDTQIALDQWTDWPKEFYLDDKGGPWNVGELLDELRAYDDSSWLQITREGDVLHVRGMLHEEQHAEYQEPLTAAFRAASRVGARGEVVVCDTEMVDFAWRIGLADGKSVLSEVPKEQRGTLRPIMTEAIEVADAARQAS